MMWLNRSNYLLPAPTGGGRHSWGEMLIFASLHRTPVVSDLYSNAPPEQAVQVAEGSLRALGPSVTI